MYADRSLTIKGMFAMGSSVFFLVGTFPLGVPLIMLRMHEIPFAPLCNHGKPLFVGIYRGIIILGFRTSKETALAKQEMQPLAKCLSHPGVQQPSCFAQHVGLKSRVYIYTYMYMHVYIYIYMYIFIYVFQQYFNTREQPIPRFPSTLACSRHGLLNTFAPKTL